MDTPLTRRLGMLLALAGVLFFSGVSDCFAKAVACNKDIVETAVVAGDFKTLVKALEAADLVETLKGKGPFTMFAPTDDAFAKLPPGTLDDLLKPANKEKLRDLLTYHVVPGKVIARDLTGPGEFPTIGGKKVKLDYGVMVNRAHVTQADVEATNGVIHVIDKVLMPKSVPPGGPKDIMATAVAAGDLKTLTKALKTAGLVGALQGPGPFTVFAPTDDAFDKLAPGTLGELLMPRNKGKLAGILTYHVVPSKLTAKEVSAMKSAKTLNGQELAIAVKEGVVMVDKAKVTKTDIVCSNGVIHVIDTVVMPKAPYKDIVDTAMAGTNFRTLVKALQAAEMVDRLKGRGPLTVFAPTDEAFAKLPPGRLDDLLKPENKEKLKGILSRHVVPGKYMARDLTGIDVTEATNGQNLRFMTRANVEKARIVRTNIDCSNGVIHAVDTVIMD